MTVTFRHRAHGTYIAPSFAVDAAIAEYLPASASSLRAIVSERAPEQDWDDVLDVSAFLVILADFDYVAP